MSKHTPGPWFSPDGKTIKQDYRPIGLTEAAGCIIGSVMGGPTSGPAFIEVAEEVAANTRLIAAAPDLLEALEDLKREVVLSDVDLGYVESHFRPWINKAESAVARARNYLFCPMTDVAVARSSAMRGWIKCEAAKPAGDQVVVVWRKWPNWDCFAAELDYWQADSSDTEGGTWYEAEESCQHIETCADGPGEVARPITTHWHPLPSDPTE